MGFPDRCSQHGELSQAVNGSTADRRSRWSSSPRHHLFFSAPALSPRRHLNELEINFVLVALASLRMEMMMDNNDATTGSPSRRCNADDKSSAPLESPSRPHGDTS